MAAVRCRNFEEVEEVALDIYRIVFHLQTVYFQEKNRDSTLQMFKAILQSLVVLRVPL